MQPICNVDSRTFEPIHTTEMCGLCEWSICVGRWRWLTHWLFRAYPPSEIAYVDLRVQSAKHHSIQGSVNICYLDKP